ncbi:MAG: FkbM family methyltransferase [Pseudomonadota bacterium]
MASLFFDAQMSGVQWFRGIVHVGANVGQEVEFYAKLKDVPAILIEPLPNLIPLIEDEVAANPQGDFHVEQICCSDVDDETAEFYVSPDPISQASSLLAPGRIVERYPWLANTELTEVKTITVDTLLARHYPDFPVNMIAIDTQGADLKVLKGAEHTLQRCDGIYIEVSDERVYQGGCTFKEIIDYLDAQDFGLYRSIIKPEGWGNAFFKKRSSPNASEIAEIASRNLLLDKPTSAGSVFRGKAKSKLVVNGEYDRSQGYRSQTRDHEWLEIDMGGEHDVEEIILVGPANRARFLTVKVSTRTASGEWRVVFDYAEEQRILTRFDRIPVANRISGIRIETQNEGLMLAQVLAIAASKDQKTQEAEVEAAAQ